MPQSRAARGAAMVLCHDRRRVCGSGILQCTSLQCENGMYLVFRNLNEQYCSFKKGVRGRVKEVLAVSS